MSMFRRRGSESVSQPQLEGKSCVRRRPPGTDKREGEILSEDFFCHHCTSLHTDKNIICESRATCTGPPPQSAIRPDWDEGSGRARKKRGGLNCCRSLWVAVETHIRSGRPADFSIYRRELSAAEVDYIYSDEPTFLETILCQKESLSALPR